MTAPVVAWTLTRIFLLLTVFRVVVMPGVDPVSDVTVIYHGWYDVMLSGRFPYHDVTWQYPPAAALAILSPALLPFLSYTTAFIWLTFVSDMVGFGMLLRAGKTREGKGGPRAMAGAWVWVGMVLIGPTVYARYDLQVTVVAVASLLAASRLPGISGGIAGFGAMLKVWPAFLLVGVRSRRAWAGAAIAVVAIAAFFYTIMPGSFAFLNYQRDRGTEVESVGSLVFHIARRFGLWHGYVTLHYGSLEFIGPWVSEVSTAALWLSVAAFGWLLLWRFRAREFTAATTVDAAFTAVLLFTTTSRVISPQYMVWLVGLAAVCMTVRASVLTLPAMLVLVATAVTGVEWPGYFGDVVNSTDKGIMILLLRNGLLVAASLCACRRLWVGYVRKGPEAAADPRGASGSGLFAR
jgi:hypothetical protein